jgi:hypothetical protein
VNHRHHRGPVSILPPTWWGGGNRPAQQPPIRNADATPMPQPSPEIAQLLAELETVLATAEEVRHRIHCALSAPGQRAQPAAHQPRQAPPPATTTTTALDTTNLIHTGRGLWAWAKETGHTDALVDLGKQAGFPARIVDWSPSQVDEAVGALEQLLAGTGSIPPATAPKPDHRIRKPRTDRVYDPGVDDLPY